MKYPNQTAQTLSKALINVTQLLNLTQKELSEILGSSQSEIRCVFKKASVISPKTKEGECALLLIKLYRSLDSVLGGDEQQCQKWFKSYNKHLGAKPIELSRKIEGLVGILVYLEAMTGVV